MFKTETPDLKTFEFTPQK